MHDLEFLERNPNNNPSFYEVTDNIRATIHYENCWITWFFTFTAWAVMFLQTEALSEQKVYECCLQKKKTKQNLYKFKNSLSFPLKYFKAKWRERWTVSLKFQSWLYAR